MAYPISDITRRIVYSGSAGVGPYSFAFEILDQTDIAVYKNTTLLTLTTDYSVSINVDGTGSITLVSAAVAADNITLSGARAIERTTDFVTGGDLFANSLNDELDSLVIFTQQVDEKAGRSIKAPVTDSTSINMTLPASATRAGKLAGFTASGDVTVSTSTVAQVDAAVASFVNATGNNAASILYDPLGTGAVQTTVQAKLRERFISVKDYGAVGDGVADDKTAINLAFTYAISQGGGTVYFPKGTYRITGYIGRTGSATNQIDLAVIGEPGTVIECDPSVADNYAFYFLFPNLETLYVSGFRINCNNKVANGIFISTSSPYSTQSVVVENCQVYDAYCVDDVSITRAATGINIGSSAWGFRAMVRNCYVNNVSREVFTGSQACTGIFVGDHQLIEISSCTIRNVSHNNQSLQDADGIKVFSFNNSGDYYKTNVLIQNNNVEDCDGRLVKLQTEGQATVTGNYFSLTGAMTLINNWKGIDSQVADMDCHHNTWFIDDNWSGGASANLVSLQQPAAGTVQYNNEGFYQRFNNNIVESRKNMPYFVIPAFMDTGIVANQYVEICDNIVNYIDTADSSASTMAFTEFVYLNSAPAPADLDGQIFWTIARNRVMTYNFIRLTWTQSDYTDKWWVQVYDNWKGPTGYSRSIFYQGNTDGGYTSNIMIRDNMIGQGAGIFAWPSDSTKWMNGTDVETGDSLAGVISPAPANYRNGRMYKKGGVLGVETVSSATPYKYISTNNGTNWYQI